MIGAELLRVRGRVNVAGLAGSTSGGSLVLGDRWDPLWPLPLCGQSTATTPSHPAAPSSVGTHSMLGKDVHLGAGHFRPHVLWARIANPNRACDSRSTSSCSVGRGAPRPRRGVFNRYRQLAAVRGVKDLTDVEVTR